MVYLNFIWHMHQPYYKDDVSDKTLMPWVFLHAIKDYYDMPYMLSRFGDIKATFNLVPSLLVQIDSYAKDEANDLLLEVLKLNCDDLDEKNISKLNEYIFAANETNMIKPLWRYYELHKKYLTNSKSLENFSSNEILDAEVLFLLAWCGNYLRQNNDIVKKLIVQGANFTETQKLNLLNELFYFCGTIVNFYKKLEEDGQIEISTTHFYHPILPILLDPKVAAAANQNVKLPNIDCDFKEFATMQVQEAANYFENKFEQSPLGFWPAEGSLSEDTLMLLGANNIKWVATDEDLLFRTMNNFDRNILYNRFIHSASNIELFFRDKYLSDLIGFDYSQKDANEATDDFIGHIKKIGLTSHNDCLISVILDGENAWEFYPNNGWDFFEKLYFKLTANKNIIKTILPKNVHTLNLKHIELHKLQAGSWINGNFDIWIGKSEKNSAWEMIATVYGDYLKKASSLSYEADSKIKKEFMIALGSDWFWWYDDDHFSLQKSEFDELFRTHIKNIYLLMDEEIPKKLDEPIAKNNANSSGFGAMHKTTQAVPKASEFRYCKLSKRWVLFAPKRANRPNNFIVKKPTKESEFCPFDVGCESCTPNEIDKIIKEDGSWSARVVPNLYNVLSIEVEPDGKKDEYFDVFSGFGAHEVIVETPNHNRQMFDFEVAEFVDYLTICKRRVDSLHRDKRLAYVSLFKNSGELAGASMRHSHSQIIATPFVPNDVEDEVLYKKEYFKEYKRAILDDLVYEEKQYESNLIFENDSFICYAPYASRFAYEVKIVAKDEISTICEFDQKLLHSLGAALHTIFSKYKNLLGEFDFNMIFKNHPYEGYGEKSKEYFRFCICIYPRLNGIAGFELDSSVYLNSILPNIAAKKLREI